MIILIYILAVYGAISLIFKLLDSVCLRANLENYGVQLVLLFKNQEETAEGVIRNIFAGDLLRKLRSNRKLITVDMGSSDETLKILSKLKDCYESLEVLKIDEKENVFTYFEVK